MSRVETIENQVKKLTPVELKAFRQWFAEFEADLWDREFEADAKAGKLADLAEQALRDHRARRSTKL